MAMKKGNIENQLIELFKVIYFPENSSSGVFVHNKNGVQCLYYPIIKFLSEKTNSPATREDLEHYVQQIDLLKGNIGKATEKNGSARLDMCWSKRFNKNGDFSSPNEAKLLNSIISYKSQDTHKFDFLIKPQAIEAVKNAIAFFDKSGEFHIGAKKINDLIQVRLNYTRVKTPSESKYEQKRLPASGPQDEDIKFPLNQILYGPPGTGKTFITAQKAVEICHKQKFPEPIDIITENEIREQYKELCEKKQITFVTFHQSMGYEDFVEGLRPVALEGSAGFTLKPKDGIFKKICNNAKDNPNENFVIIIDEINRGNVSKIFGELITLLEDDKRLGAKYVIQVTLPYSEPYSDTPFGVPSNVYIIGTMNTADRSTAPIDTALRRRFEFTEMMPKYDLLDKTIEGIPLRDMLKTINERIEEKYDRDHQIGHAYLMKVGKKADLDKVFKNKIIPLLQEYFYENYKKIDEILGTGFRMNDGNFDYSKLIKSGSTDDDNSDD